jgi:hypothetical protein
MSSSSWLFNDETLQSWLIGFRSLRYYPGSNWGKQKTLNQDSRRLRRDSNRGSPEYTLISLPIQAGILQSRNFVLFLPVKSNIFHWSPHHLPFSFPLLKASENKRYTYYTALKCKDCRAFGGVWLVRPTTQIFGHLVHKQNSTPTFLYTDLVTYHVAMFLFTCFVRHIKKHSSVTSMQSS